MKEETKEKLKKIGKFFLFSLGSLIIIFFCFVVKNIFLSTLCLFIGIFLIPSVWAHQYFYKKDWVQPEIIEKFLCWGMTMFFVAWVVGFITGIFMVPEKILNDPDEGLYFSYLLSQARIWALIVGIGTGTYKAWKEYTFLESKK